MSLAGGPISDSRRQAEFRERLTAARFRLARTVAATDQEGQALAPADTRALAGILERLQGQERHQLDEIDAAQARLQAGLFGVCEECHQAIPLARLRAMPAARHCAGCQSHREAAR